VDGSTPKRHSAYLSKGRGRLAVFTNDLSPGSHELVLTVLSERNSRSSGNWIRINAMMSNPPAAATGIAAPRRASPMAAVRNPLPRNFSDGNILLSRPGTTGEAHAIDWMNLQGRTTARFRGVSNP
jgi:hypothetical protein